MKRILTSLGLCAMIVTILGLAVTASAQVNLVQTSASSPFAGCSILPLLGELNYVNAEVEPWVAVNPQNANNILGVWQQDRWNFGGARGLVTGVSHDAGQTWHRTFAHFSSCAGGTASNGGNYERASDPWVTFAPNGVAHQISLSFDVINDPNQAILVSRSTNGGNTWSEPIALIRDTDPTIGDDKESITADPKNANLVYATWDRLVCTDATCAVLASGPTWFSRTTNGGASWEPAKIIFDPGAGNQTIANQIVVAPNGNLYNLFTLILNANSNTPTIQVAIIRSKDQGVTWSSPTIINSLQSVGIVDPKTGEPVRTGDIIPNIAIDKKTGALYVVWQDSRFSGGARDGIAFSKSTDGGATWSTPVQVNKAPKVQAFTAAINVADDGFIGVTYYDFRKDNANPKVLLTDYWLVTSTNGGNAWSESHIAGSFDMRTAPNAFGFFVGDYEGLGHIQESFLPFFVKTNSGNLKNPTDVFAALTEDQGNETNGHEEVNAHPQSVQQMVESHRENKHH